MAVIQKQLNSKSEAVMILNSALDSCVKERDEFKNMAEQVHLLIVLFIFRLWKDTKHLKKHLLKICRP